MKRFSAPYFGIIGSLLLPAHLLHAQTTLPKAQVSAPAAIYKPLLGFWKGDLTYRDYTSDKQVTLPTTLDVTATPDAKSLRMHYVYDDGPGKQVEETDIITIDPAKHTYWTQTLGEKTSRTYTVSGLEPFAQKGGGTLVLFGTGEDNGKKVAVRNTLTQIGQTLTILHEARLPGAAYRFRNRYNFTRSKNAPPVTRLTAPQLQADFAIFKKAYEALHPGLYRYNTPAQMARHFDTLQTQLGHEQNLSDAYLAFATFLAKIKCGHTYPNFFNQPAAVAEELFVSRPRLPFYFRWINHKMIVTRSLVPSAHLAPGTEVLSLNGVPVAKIRECLLSVSRADGSNDAKRESNLEVRGDSTYEAFDVYYPLLFPITGTQFTAQLKSAPSTAPVTRTLPLMTQVQRLAIQSQDAAHATAAFGDTPGWEFRFLDDARTAYLRMPTWALYNSKWDWRAYLDKVFAQIAAKKSENLVIDLRGNEGGLSIGNYVVGKLIQKDLPLPSFQRWVRYRQVPDDLSPYLDTWDPSFKNWGNDIRSADNPSDSYFRLTRFDDGPGGDVIKADAHPFTGRTFVIVGAANSSATFEFAQILQQNRLATLVGQPTGGNQRGINGGAFFFLRLPNSKIETDLPLVALFSPDVHPAPNRLLDSSQPDAGLTPDILVTPRLEDIRMGADTELNTIQHLLQKNDR